MAQEELSDILLKSVDDSVSIALEKKGYKPHFAMDSGMAFEYNVMLTNYLRAKTRTEFSDRACFREIHSYLVNMTRSPDEKPARKQEEDDNSNYDMNEGPKIKITKVNLEAIATKAKTIGIAGIIVSAAGAAYSILKPAVLDSALALGSFSAAALGIGLYLIYAARKKEGAVEDKSIGNKKEMRKAYELIQGTDFMAWGGVLESNRELIIEKLKPAWDKQ